MRRYIIFNPLSLRREHKISIFFVSELKVSSVKTLYGLLEVVVLRDRASALSTNCQHGFINKNITQIFQSLNFALIKLNCDFSVFEVNGFSLDQHRTDQPHTQNADALLITKNLLV